MELLSPRQEPVVTFEDWARIFESPKKLRHWKVHRSAHSLAEYIMRKNGLDRVRNRISEAIGSVINFDKAIIEHEVRFDSFGHGREHDLGIFGKTDSGQSVYVGLEAKVDETFGPPVLEIYLDAKSRQLSGVSTNAPERVEQLMQFNFKQVDPNKFDLRYQLLYATAGTLAVEADVSILYITSFKTPLYDELIGAENFRDYLAFMRCFESRSLPISNQQSDVREIEVGDSKLLCIYEHVPMGQD